jgi:hypothetical protein
VHQQVAESWLVRPCLAVSPVSIGDAKDVVNGSKGFEKVADAVHETRG